MLIEKTHLGTAKIYLDDQRRSTGNYLCRYLWERPVLYAHDLYKVKIITSQIIPSQYLKIGAEGELKGLIERLVRLTRLTSLPISGGKVASLLEYK